jgi:hypothetical protein
MEITKGYRGKFFLFQFIKALLVAQCFIVTPVLLSPPTPQMLVFLRLVKINSFNFDCQPPKKILRLITEE